MSTQMCTYLQSAPTDLNPVSQGEGKRMTRFHTCNVGVWTEIKRTIVVSWRVGTVGGNVPTDPVGKIEEVYHVLRDCTVVLFERCRVEAVIVVRDSKTLNVRRPDCGIVAVHVERERGEGVTIGAPGVPATISRTAGGTPKSAVWAAPCCKDGRSTPNAK